MLGFVAVKEIQERAKRSTIRSEIKYQEVPFSVRSKPATVSFGEF